MSTWFTSSCPLLVCIQEDIEKELSKVSRASRGPALSQHILVWHPTILLPFFSYRTVYGVNGNVFLPKTYEIIMWNTFLKLKRKIHVFQIILHFSVFVTCSNFSTDSKFTNIITLHSFTLSWVPTDMAVFICPELVLFQ